jgi:hypothetical protein
MLYYLALLVPQDRVSLPLRADLLHALDSWQRALWQQQVHVLMMRLVQYVSIIVIIMPSQLVDIQQACSD